MGNDGCPSHGWSIITSAPANSQLAGLLAGFLFSGIVILFALKGSNYTRALSLFFATFIVLGFDSYLFNLVSGDSPDPYCSRVWSEGMAASGMLGGGAAGLFNGICWLLSVHVDTVTTQYHGTEKVARVARTPARPVPRLARPVPRLARPVPRLDRMGALMVHGTNAIISLLLARTAFDYLGIIYGHQARWVEALWQWVYVVPAVVVGTTLILAWYRTRRWRRTSSRPDDGHKRSISFTVYGMLAYGLVGTIFAGTLTNFPDSLWASPPLALVIITIAVELLMPGALLVGLVLAVPFLDRSEQEDGPAADGAGNLRKEVPATSPTGVYRNASTPGNHLRPPTHTMH